VHSKKVLLEVVSKPQLAINSVEGLSDEKIKSQIQHGNTQYHTLAPFT
jgi:hypothetical protein